MRTAAPATDIPTFMAKVRVQDDGNRKDIESRGLCRMHYSRSRRDRAVAS